MKCAACSERVCAPDEAFTGDVCPHCRHFVHPTRLGVYTDLELLKRGGMGAVYAARHPTLGTAVAIKVVSASGGPDNLAERFAREAKLAAQIPHPAVVRVYDSDVQDGRLYLVMEFVAGRTIRERLRETGAAGAAPTAVAEVVALVAELADCLAAAHRVGIVHRDIKPENVMVDSTGRVRVLDFGISRVVDAEEQLTRTGEILGTPEYMAPEQILDEADAVDARADVYAAGVLLYELLTGRSPFAGSNLFQTLKLVESRVPPPPSSHAPAVPPALDALVQSTLDKSPAQRPRDGAALAAALREVQPAATATTPVPAPNHALSPVLWIVLLAAVTAVGGWLLGRLTAPPVDDPSTAAVAGAGAEAPPTWPPEQQLLEHALPALLPWAGATRYAQAGTALEPYTDAARALLDPSVPRGERLAAAIERSPRDATPRYLLEALRALDADDLHRLRAACELANLTGSADLTAQWFVTGRVWLAGSGDPALRLAPQACADLLGILEDLAPAAPDVPAARRLPGVATVRALLTLGAGDVPGALAIAEQADQRLDPLCAHWTAAHAAGRGPLANARAQSALGDPDAAEVLSQTAQLVDLTVPAALGDATVALALAGQVDAAAVAGLDAALEHALEQGLDLDAWVARLGAWRLSGPAREFVTARLRTAARTRLEGGADPATLAPLAAAAHALGLSLDRALPGDEFAALRGALERSDAR